MDNSGDFFGLAEAVRRLNRGPGALVRVAGPSGNATPSVLDGWSPSLATAVSEREKSMPSGVHPTGAERAFCGSIASPRPLPEAAFQAHPARSS